MGGQQEGRMKIIIEIELNELEVKRIQTNSIERVMNNAIRIGRVGSDQLTKSGDREDASILSEDCEDLKWTVVQLWNAARNEIFKVLRKEGGLG
jgi:hypothetical protein